MRTLKKFVNKGIKSQILPELENQNDQSIQNNLNSFFVESVQGIVSSTTPYDTNFLKQPIKINRKLNNFFKISLELKENSDKSKK